MQMSRMSLTVDKRLVRWSRPNAPLLEADEIQGSRVEVGSDLIQQNIDIHGRVDESKGRCRAISSFREPCVLASVYHSLV